MKIKISKILGNKKVKTFSRKVSKAEAEAVIELFKHLDEIKKEQQNDKKRNT